MIKFVTYATRPKLIAQAELLEGNAFPDFLCSPTYIKLWESIMNNYPDYQLIGLDSDTEEIIGIANSIPIDSSGRLDELSDEGWHWTVSNSKTNTFYHAGLSIVICKKYQDLGYAKQFLTALKQLGKDKRHISTLIPVRPTFKKNYPLIPIADYITWKNLFDPWLRSSFKAGWKNNKNLLALYANENAYKGLAELYEC